MIPDHMAGMKNPYLPFLDIFALYIFPFLLFENYPWFVIGQGSEKIVLDRQISFSELMVDVDLEAHRLLLQQVDLPLSYPEILVLCQSYSLVDPSCTKVGQGGYW